MTIDEAIAKYKEITNADANCPAHCNISCDKCVQESKQIAEWLEDYRRLLEFEKSVLANEDGYLAIMCERIGYNKAIDDFVNEIKDELNRFEVKNLDTCVLFDFIDRKAEQLKAGVKYEM